MASATTAAGTRKPTVNGTRRASGLPRWVSVSCQSVAAHGAVACARSPRRVSEPCSHRRAIARQLHRRQVLRLVHHDVSVARQPVDEPGGLVDENASAADHFAVLTVRGGRSQRSADLLLVGEQPLGRSREHGLVGQH